MWPAVAETAETTEKAEKANGVPIRVWVGTIGDGIDNCFLIHLSKVHKNQAHQYYTCDSLDIPF